MALLSAQSISLAYGSAPLLENAGFNLNRGDRACLLGRNGEGKSSLLRLLAGLEPPDNGQVICAASTRIALLTQAVPPSLPGTVRDRITASSPDHSPDPEQALEAEKLLSQLELDPETPFDSLSGGQRRRVMLAAELSRRPDILLLDEPTNHLDLEGIAWLERFLPRFEGALLFVSHDRRFLRILANRILELDRGALREWNCDYDTFLRRREEVLEAEEKQNALFDKRLAAEERWIRQGIKARRTRNEGRVRALKKLREERARRREQSPTATLKLQSAARGGQNVLTAENLQFGWPDSPVVNHLSLRIGRGDKIGILGPNGCGKTTLIRLLLGDLAPQAGSVEHGTRLKITYLDQHREALDEEKSVQENVGEGAEFVTINGHRRHILSYLEDFLFAPARSRTPVKVLSGGERNRIYLAKRFLQPGNLLVLDEPTNDLDLETLELLEALLVDYPGTLILVSHDREFMNNVVTGTLAWEGPGEWREYPGGYDDWLQQSSRNREPTAPKTTPSPAAKRPKSLTGNEKKELAQLPEQLEALDAELEALGQQLSTPEFYQLPEEEQQEVRDRVATIPEKQERLFARWEELEARSGKT